MNVRFRETGEELTLLGYEDGKVYVTDGDDIDTDDPALYDVQLVEGRWEPLDQALKRSAKLVPDLPREGSC